MEPNNSPEEKPQKKRSSARWKVEFRAFFKDRFSLEDDKAQRDEVVANISKGVEFRGVNLWILIFATMIASLGLNVNSAAVIIGAMLISPIMGPIMGIGMSLGINDFSLLKRSLRNFTLMFVIAIITSTIYFLISPLEAARSELLARTVPTTYDVLIALFGGLAGIVAQSRKDRTSTVIPGVAIATALMPPLCTAGFGLATGQLQYFIGAFYLFLINSVFIALATYAMVRFLKYEKETFIDKKRERNAKRLMMLITLITFIPSVFIGFHMVRVSVFDAMADKYVNQVFNHRHTRVIEYTRTYKQGTEPSRIELTLVGEVLDEEMIESAREQLSSFGLREAELVVRQANGANEDEVDVNALQKSYTELLHEKNRQISEMKAAVSRYKVTNVEVDDLSKEVGVMIHNVATISLTKGVTFDVSGVAKDTLIVCVVTPKDSTKHIDKQILRQWLRIRTKVNNIKLFVEPQSVIQTPADESK
ncbi:MAG: TIGR00341 family protein [Alistipes sp.]